MLRVLKGIKDIRVQQVIQVHKVHQDPQVPKDLVVRLVAQDLLVLKVHKEITLD